MSGPLAGTVSLSPLGSMYASELKVRACGVQEVAVQLCNCSLAPHGNSPSRSLVHQSCSPLAVLLLKSEWSAKRAVDAPSVLQVDQPVTNHTKIPTKPLLVHGQVMCAVQRHGHASPSERAPFCFRFRETASGREPSRGSTSVAFSSRGKGCPFTCIAYLCFPLRIRGGLVHTSMCGLPLVGLP